MVVTSTVPIDTKVDALQSIGGIEDRTVMSDNCKDIDKSMLLLRMEDGSLQKTESIQKSLPTLPIAESASIATTDVPFVSFGPQQTIDTGTDNNSGSRIPVDNVTSTENVRKLEG